MTNNSIFRTKQQKMIGYDQKEHSFSMTRRPSSKKYLSFPLISFYQNPKDIGLILFYIP